MHEEIKLAVKEAGVYLEKLASGGIAGLANCQYVALIAANLNLIRAKIAEEEKKAAEGAENDKNSDDICGQ